MKLSDYVADALVAAGVRDVFLIAGGGIMHLLDSVGSHPGLRYHTFHHEQAAVVAAEGYARCTGRIGVVLVTVGPGAANAVAGLPGAWVDSVPMLVLAGQVRSDLIADYARMRQFGPQEANTLDMARPVCTYAARVATTGEVREQLERALHAATSGRPGPAWLEFPLDVQGANVDETALRGFTPPTAPADGAARLAADADAVAELLARAERPLLVPGNGVRLGNAVAVLERLLDAYPLPVALPITAKDLVEESRRCFMGIFGTAGQRRANFAVQNCDLLLGLGSGLNVQKTGFNVSGFAPKATKVLVDIDAEQLRGGAVKADRAVQADVGPFLEALLERLAVRPPRPSARWLSACERWKERYSPVTDDYRESDAYVNSYAFMDVLSDVVRASDTIVPGAGLDTASCYQVFRVQRGQRVLISGWGSMGWELPLSIGACVGTGRRVVTVTGDGSLSWNVQELLTVAHYGLPIKLFVFNNGGFASIRATQTSFFEGRLVGADATSGIANPDFSLLARAHGLEYRHIARNSELGAALPAFLADDRPGLCEVAVAPEQGVWPKASAFRRADGTFESRPLEDMAPFLPREEVAENMHLFDEESATR